ncbi:hypothetical protein J6590_026912 [Homalodisca vitripennis]|nr:hypothetical protein J6590_026912 [Homalodisca vitripennis]
MYELEELAPSIQPVGVVNLKKNPSTSHEGETGIQGKGQANSATNPVGEDKEEEVAYTYWRAGAAGAMWWLLLGDRPTNTPTRGSIQRPVD